MTELYRCDKDTEGYIVRKFDADYTLESKYNVTLDECDCPRGDRPTCRHRQYILPLFLKHKHIGDGWFLDFNTRQWRQPVKDIDTGEALTGDLNDVTLSGRSPSVDCDTALPVEPVAQEAAGTPQGVSSPAASTKPSWRRI